MLKKLAFVHCRIMPGGAFNVLKDLIVEEINTNAQKEIQIFTLISNIKKIKIENYEFKIITALPGRLNRFFLYCTSKKLPILSCIFDYRNLILGAPLFMKILSRKIKKFNPDEIHISSFAIAKNIEQCKKTSQFGKSKSIVCKLYLHSPMQYIRSHYDEYLEKLKGRKAKIFKRITPKLRKRDIQFNQYNIIYANSQYTAALAKKIYEIDAQIKYPQITGIPKEIKVINNPLPYYIYVGRLVKFVKEVDKIINLFNHTQDPLIIIGNGPDKKELQSIAKKNILFVDWIDDKKELYTIIANAKGYINITKESFGISTVEALLLGVPIFGYQQGATAELVDENSGILVEKKDFNTLLEKFKEFKSRTRERDKISKNIKKKFKI